MQINVKNNSVPVYIIYVYNHAEYNVEGESLYKNHTVIRSD